MRVFSLREYLHHSLTIMKYLGLWPRNNYSTDKCYLVYSIIINGFFNGGTSISLVVGLFKSSKPLEDAFAAGIVILGVLATVKSIFAITYNSMFKLLVQEEVHKTADIELNGKQNKILCDYVGFWRKIHVNYSYLSIVTAINYFVMPVFSKTPYMLPLPGWYPFNYKKPVVYELVYLYQCITLVVDLFLNLTGATFTAGFLAYLSAECDVLVDVLKSLSKDTFAQRTMEIENFKKCIKYHKEVLKYSKSMESYFSKYLLIQFASSCLTTALIMTSLTKNRGFNIDFIHLCVMQLGVWAELYIYCWYGHEVTEKSKNIPSAAFESNWVDASREYKKDILIFICRTQKPIKIYAVNLFELSLDTLIAILRMAYSYYMLFSQLSMEE